MNLRQKYKKAKHRLDILEKSTKPIPIQVIPHDIVQLQAVHKFDKAVITMLGPNDVIEELLDSTRQYITVEHEPDIFTDKEIVRAKLNIAIPRR